MTYAKKTLSEIKLIHGDYGNFIKGQKLDKKKEKKYKTPPYQDLAASTEIEGETLDEKCWPGYEKKGMKTMFGKRYPNCVKKKKTKKEEFSDWRSELEQIEEKKMTKAQIKKRDEIADAISTKDMKDRYGDKNVKYAIATKLAMKEELNDDDKPFVKKLVGKLRKGSKTHAKQADDLEKAMKENVNLKFHLGGNKKEISLNYGNTPIAYKRTEKFTKRTEPKVAIDRALNKIKEDITDEALTIQDWNVDDIKFTEIETVDIIKAKPLKENVKKKIIVKGIKALGNLSKKTKIKPISPKPVATPGTTYATGGKFPPGYFSNVPDYAGAVPKPTKTGVQMYSTTYDLGTKLSPGAIKPVKGAFKGGGSLKGRIDPDTGRRVPVKDYIDIMKSKGKKYYEPVKGAKFGDKIMATNRKAFEPAIKQEKLPLPKPRKEPKFKVRDDATFGDQIMVRKNEPFSRNFTGRTPMPKPSGKAKYEVGKKGVDEFRGGDMYSKVGFRSFKDKKYGFPGLKKPASAPKDASRLYEPKGYRDYTPKRDMPTTNPEAGRVLFGKGELKTGVKKKGKTIYKENIDLDEGIKKEIAKKLVKKLAKQFKKAKNIKGPFDVTGKEAMKMKRTGSSKLDFPIDKVTSQNIQTKSIINQAKKANELGMKKLSNKKSLSGKDLSKPIKVNLQKKIDFDKYLGGTSNKIQKKFGTTTPTGTFTDDLPPVKTVPLNKSQLDLMKKTTSKKIKKKVKKITMKDKMKEIKNDPMSKVIKKQIEKETGTKTRKFSQKGGVTKGNENEILSNVKQKNKKPLKDHYDWRTEIDEDWQKVNRKDKTDGLSKAAVKAYRRENPGSKLQTAVTKDPKKLKKGSKSAKRRLSFCRRMKGMKKKLTSAKTRRDPDSRINKALRRWNC